MTTPPPFFVFFTGRYQESLAFLQSRLLSELSRIGDESRAATARDVAALLDGAASFCRDYVTGLSP